MTDGVLRLRDGRRLGLAEFGDPAGPVVLYFHGHPGARKEAGLLAGAARRAGVRLIGVDRPGMGDSDQLPGRTVLDWPGDIEQLADRWGVDRFSVLGFSAGAPYALACAYRLPHRVDGCALASPATPVGLVERLTTGWLSWLLLGAGWLFRDEQRASWSLDRISWRWPPPDRRVLAMPAVRAGFVASLAEAFRRGPQGAAYDGVLLSRPWDLPLGQITTPVFLWHGNRDREVPVAAARRLAADLPGCRPVWCPDDGHLSVLLHRADEIMTTLNPHRSPSVTS